jgi:hypothetical protein
MRKSSRFVGHALLLCLSACGGAPSDPNPALLGAQGLAPGLFPPPLHVLAPRLPTALAHPVPTHPAIPPGLLILPPATIVMTLAPASFSSVTVTATLTWSAPPGWTVQLFLDSATWSYDSLVHPASGTVSFPGFTTSHDVDVVATSTAGVTSRARRHIEAVRCTVPSPAANGTGLYTVTGTQTACSGDPFGIDPWTCNTSHGTWSAQIDSTGMLMIDGLTIGLLVSPDTGFFRFEAESNGCHWSSVPLITPSQGSVYGSGDIETPYTLSLLQLNCLSDDNSWSTTIDASGPFSCDPSGPVCVDGMIVTCGEAPVACGLPCPNAVPPGLFVW